MLDQTVVLQVLQFELPDRGTSLRVGLIGLMSPDAALCSTFHRRFGRFVGFDDAQQRMAYDQLHAMAAAKADELRNEHHNLALVLKIE